VRDVISLAAKRSYCRVWQLSAGDKSHWDNWRKLDQMYRTVMVWLDLKPTTYCAEDDTEEVLDYLALKRHLNLRLRICGFTEVLNGRCLSCETTMWDRSDEYRSKLSKGQWKGHCGACPPKGYLRNECDYYAMRDVFMYNSEMVAEYIRFWHIRIAPQQPSLCIRYIDELERELKGLKDGLTRINRVP